MADIQKLNVNSTTYDISVPWGKVTGKPSTFPPESHTHSYLPLSGGTLTGPITIKKTITDEHWGAMTIKYNGGWSAHKNYIAGINVEDATGIVGRFGVTFDGSYGKFIVRGLYYNSSYDKSDEVFSVNAVGDVTATKFIGSLSGNASSATKLTTDAGSTTNPIYFSGGKPVACTYSLNKTVPADAKFTDTNTWRPITDSVSTTNSTISASATAVKTAYDKANHSHPYLPTAGGAMTGKIIMNTGTGLSMFYTGSSTTGDPWIYPYGADSYGIRYFEGNPDKMAISATGNNTTIAGADLCINGNGDGTVTIRGNNICHAGNISSYALTSLPSHNHDDRYYTETEVNNLLANKANSSHGTHVSGTSFSSGNSGTAEHNCNSITSNGHWYYNSNGPATSLGAASTDGALYSQAYSDTWVGQIAQDYRNGNLFTRGKNNGTWTAWKAVSYSGHTHTSFANSITVTGSVSASSGFYQSSDERLKTFYDPIKVDLEKLKTLRKNYFKFNDNDKLEIGVSAQEIQSLYPELVSSDDNGYLSVAYDKLSVVALAALDEQQKEIDDLKDQLSTIKNILKEKGIL